MRYTSNQQVRQPGPKGRRPPKSQPAPPKYTATATHRAASQVQRQRHRENNRAITKKPGSGQHGQTVGIATIVGSGTHSALFHGGVSGHAAGVPTALCRSSNGPGHGKLGHEICKQNSPGRSSDSLNPTAPLPMPSPPLNKSPIANRQSPPTNRQGVPANVANPPLKPNPRLASPTHPLKPGGIA